MTLALILAVSANLSFSLASLWFTEFSRKVSPLWMNAFKAIVSLISSGIGLLFISQYVWTLDTFGILALSGLVGLCIGDLFMLVAMRDIGGSRMVMMFGLSPFLTGVGSKIFFNSELPLKAWIGVLFMVACLVLLTMERYKISGKWHITGLLFGLLAVVLDASGLLLTKTAFLMNENLNPIQANFQRAIGAMVGFLLLSQFYQRIFLVEKFRNLKSKERITVVVASFLGTFLSLVLFLSAVRLGHLSVVSSVAGTGPLFTQIFESIRDRRLPHPLWFAAFICMAIGFSFF